MVVEAGELSGFCLLGGAGLSAETNRALSTRPAERTGLPLPPPEQLARYANPGIALCEPLTNDRQPYGQTLSLPPDYQNRHLLVVGETGAGKSVLIENGILTNHRATDGPEILIDSKGGGTAEEYLRAHYTAHGDLEDVYYFDCTETLPAIAFFDIEPLLNAGVPRDEASARKAGQYEEILAGVMGAERYGQAVDAPKVIRNHIKALFDGVNGDDAFAHRDLYATLRHTMEQESAPTVSDDRLDSYFANLLERDREVFQKVMGGAVSRVDSIATDARLAPLFDHVPDETATSADRPHFDFADYLDDDCVIIFDFGGMEDQIKRTLTLVILANLWAALKARTERASASASLPLVNLYLEEAADVADTQLVDSLLSQGRSFDLSVTLGLQYPQQLQSPDTGTDTYLEALNETGTYVVGNVTVEGDLAHALATEEMPPKELSRRLSAMQRGEWLVRPAAPFGDPQPRPFLGRSLAPPAGHPASEDPLTGAAEHAFGNAFEGMAAQTRTAHGIPREELTPGSPSQDPLADVTTGGRGPRTDSLLPYTNRLPGCIRYEPEPHALECGRCANRYDPDIEGLERAVECCHSMAGVDRDDIPVCEIDLKLTAEEIRSSEWSIRQLLFLQAVYNAQQLRYDRREYDIVEDSMTRLREYVGIDAEAVDELLDTDLLRHDGKYPHQLYSVSPEGRTVISESYRQGVDYGHRAGDLEESAQHVLLTELGRRWLVQAFEDDPESAVEEVACYFEIREADLPAASYMGSGEEIESSTVEYEQRRLDVAGLDEEGNVVVALEAERINNDRKEAIPADYDKMAACDPKEAFWLALTRDDCYEILRWLNTPSDGTVRVEKEYSETTPPNEYRLDAAGATGIYPVSYIKRQLGE